MYYILLFNIIKYKPNRHLSTGIALLSRIQIQRMVGDPCLALQTYFILDVKSKEKYATREP